MMPNRAALTTAVTSGAPEQTPPLAPDDPIFGVVARPDDGGRGARVQDVEMFDVTPAPQPAAGEPRTRGRHGGGRKPWHARKTLRPRPAARAPERENRSGLSLPLLITGALAAGIGLTVGLTSGSDQAVPDSLSLTMPDLPTPDATPDAGPPSARPTAPATVTQGTSPTPRTPSSPATTTPSAPRTPARTSAPPPPPASPAPPPATRPPTSPPTPTTPPGPPSPGPTDPDLLSLGSTGPEVVELQLRLQQLYLYLGSADGTFGTSVQTALIRFQKARNIPEEPGVYGPLTRAALYAETHRPGRGGHHDRGGRWDTGGWDD
ncbi:peptidoglycan-binding protein [Streptomyces sp. NPDC090082]|uniref:peptidoglycan-binding domain-containing protein n=2 Tax=unclassified Streptomyces TaxID=2593676 RepID=UPI0038030626